MVFLRRDISLLSSKCLKLVGFFGLHRSVHHVRNLMHAAGPGRNICLIQALAIKSISQNAHLFKCHAHFLHSPHQNVLLSASPCRTSSFSFSTFVIHRQQRIDERHLGHLAPSISEFFLPCPFCKCQRRHLTFRSYFVSGDARSKRRQATGPVLPLMM